MNSFAKFALSVLLIGIGGRVTAADTAPSKTAPGSLDDQLLKGLDNQLLHDQPDQPVAKSAPASKEQSPPAKPAAPAPKPADPLDQQLRESLGGEDIGQEGEDANPLARIERQMREVQKRLAAEHADGAAQAEQQRIAAELAALVKQLAEQQQQQSKSGKSKQQATDRTKPGKTGQPADPNSKLPARDSTTELHDPKNVRPDARGIGTLVEKAIDRLHLPDKDREEMLQAPPDEFLPGYEAAIRRYFERIVEDAVEQSLEANSCAAISYFLCSPRR